MARYKNVTSNANIDWYLISIDRLKRIGVAVLIALITLGGYFYWVQRQKNPRILAERSIRAAQRALDQLAGSPEFNSFRLDYDRARVSLDQAKTHFTARRFPEARSVADDSLSIASAALNRIPGQQESDAQFLTVEGQVLYQKGGGEWKPAEVRTLLFSGDWVKTAANSSAELIFANGSLYTIGPNALLEIYSQHDPQTAEKQNSVKMQIGTLEVNTHDDGSTVRTSGTQVVVGQQSTAQVGVDEKSGTEVVSLRGTSSVTSAAAEGTPVQLRAGEQIAASGEGVLSDVSKITPPPGLQSPGDNQVFQLTPGMRLTLDWADVEQAIKGYQVQISRSRLFTRLVANKTYPIEKSRAIASVTDEGIYYWRVASINEAGKVGPFTQARRFRIAGAGSALESLETDKTPPALQINRPFNIGGQFYLIQGKVEPGASVFINDEEVSDVTSDGAFKKLISLDKVGWNTVVVKAVDLAGNPNIQREKVYAEE